MSVIENYNHIQSVINNHLTKVGLKSMPRVIAVTKYVTIERAKEAYDAGIRDFGENRIEGFLEKKAALPNDVTMHFIGSLQSRKVKDVIDDIDYLHALDRDSLAKEISKRATHTIKCFVQVNVAGEASKHGLSLDEVVPFIENLSNYSHIEVVGLMTMAPYTDDESQLKDIFTQLKSKRDDIQALNLHYAPCTELSMGMSNDYAIATEAGATYVRIGSSLVGKEE
ncbi:YggS family pyridoxal phosphate-dependent enzyme [Staphylococcus hyicus]|uniref:YggS family pyridoxal phosphate-dependent enzyme n=2 Tax=Staphylococcus hyicus TaxID=1284 RepID=A0ACD5FLC8_STAHY|nr:YggS family pyridoxal phosphate-dependent enzyme [Staphylococcus hyicus]AJC96434.1 YggS family pyridoxal phosphate enzyme [Staphylococcus hyicus]MCE5153234.1 YggS family pyridoxal phosphate-dependent enzyme [Staphylococcus hyicus]MCQ9290488.1 YggS family pyridoxal phosphate-dependent enzyme [Staphylococcus hyicus]MCQ9301056.1 YggS family pyridoxal phosphate-dependent enzyme [Staphylococcus hyicus]MCQ9305730.1 YggS family pyridoxal phosphate-dependent enzyme [Staphylococcus hyicus]